MQVFLTNNTALPARTIASLDQLLQILSVSIFKKIEPQWAFAKEGSRVQGDSFSN